MRALAFGVGAVGLAVMVAAIQRSESPVDRFLKSLTADQRAQAMKSFDDPYRTNWRFVPASREGIHLKDLTPDQAKLAADLLHSSLSDAGYKRVETIKGLENVLKEMEGGNPGRDQGLYTFTFFGSPSLTAPWGWRYEGHHVSLNFTYKGGRLVSSTPQFFGANPAEVMSGPQKGTRALPKEQDLAFALLGSLNTSQLSDALIATSAPGEIVTSNARKVSIQEDKGLHYADLDAKQKQALLNLVKVYTESQTGEEAKRRWNRVEPNTIVFAWMGSTKPGKGHYYRIQGSKFLIEYDNTQNDANHIHSVWRDFDGDFGEDVLADHYAEWHHSPN